MKRFSTFILLFLLCLFTAGCGEETLQSKLSKDLKVNNEQAAAIEKTLKQAGIEKYDSIQHDEMLDEYDDKPNKGFRISANGTQNIILYLTENGTVYALRYANQNLYKDGKEYYKLATFLLSTEEKIDLQARCERGISTLLVAPSTAKYPGLDGWKFSKDPEKIIVQSYVDSQNSFGAMLRGQFQVTFTSDAAKVTSIIFNGKEML